MDTSSQPDEPDLSFKLLDLSAETHRDGMNTTGDTARLPITSSADSSPSSAEPPPASADCTTSYAEPPPSLPANNSEHHSNLQSGPSQSSPSIGMNRTGSTTRPPTTSSADSSSASTDKTPAAAHPTTTQSATIPAKLCPTSILYVTEKEREKFRRHRARRLRVKEEEKAMRDAMTLKRAQDLFEGRARGFSLIEVEVGIDLVAGFLGECGVLEHCRFRMGGRVAAGAKGWEIAVDAAAMEGVVRVLQGSVGEWIIQLLIEVERPTCVPDPKVVVRDPMDVLGDATKEA